MPPKINLDIKTPNQGIKVQIQDQDKIYINTGELVQETIATSKSTSQTLDLSTISKDTLNSETSYHTEIPKNHHPVKFQEKKTTSPPRF